MLRLLHTRWPFIVLTLACLGLLAYGYYLQFARGLEPCPMCIFQRLCYLGIALISMIAAMHGPRGLIRGCYAIAALLFALFGAGIAGRQTWLQHLPADQVPECGPGLEFMLDMYPLSETIMRSLRGTGECASVEWRFLGLSIAEWSLLCFLTMIVVSAAVLFVRNPALRR